MEHIKTWSTRGLKPKRALAFWNEAISSAFLKVRTEPRNSPKAFQARLQSLSLGALAINRLQAQSYRVICNTDDSRHDWLFINLHQHGTCRLQQHGREQWAAPGDISINLGNSPFVFDFEDHVAMTCLRVPITGARAHTGRLQDAAARPLPDDAATRLLKSYIAGLLSNADHLNARQAAVATNCLLDLLTLGMEGGEIQNTDRSSVRTAIYDSACAYIDAYFGDPNLSIHHLSRHLKLAPRTLQSIFHEQGTTFTASVLESRLLAAERHIVSHTYSHLAQVAYAVGFSDQAYFNKAFRRRFDMTPGERRREAAEAH